MADVCAIIDRSLARRSDSNVASARQVRPGVASQCDVDVAGGVVIERLEANGRIARTTYVVLEGAITGGCVMAAVRIALSE